MSYGVFFDLDETIITCKSMFKVLKYYFKNTCSCLESAEQEYQTFCSKLQQYEHDNCPSREMLNQFFYRLFSGFDATLMKTICEKWFLEEGKLLLNQTIVEQIKLHQKNQAQIAIVSGSFDVCIKPIAEYLKIKTVICNQLEVNNGFYTGALLGQPIIGEGKALGIKKFMKNLSLGFSESYAYGDHHSDLSMLLLVDHPIVVGKDPQLMTYGQLNGWKNII